MANVAWLTLKYASMGNCEYPSYSDMFASALRTREKGAGEIIADVLRALEGDEEG